MPSLQNDTTLLSFHHWVDTIIYWPEDQQALHYQDYQLSHPMGFAVTREACA